MKLSFNLKAILFLTALDLISKFIVISIFNYDVNIHMYSYLSINPVQTVTGYAMDNDIINFASKFNSPEHLHYIQYALSILVTVILIFVLNQEELKKENFECGTLRYAILLMLSGTLGNMLNLVFCGFVVDFIRITTANKFVLVFNIADIYLYIAPALVLIVTFYLFFKINCKS